MSVSAVTEPKGSVKARSISIGFSAPVLSRLRVRTLSAVVSSWPSVSKLGVTGAQEGVEVRVVLGGGKEIPGRAVGGLFAEHGDEIDGQRITQRIEGGKGGQRRFAVGFLGSVDVQRGVGGGPLVDDEVGGLELDGVGSAEVAGDAQDPGVDRDAGGGSRFVDAEDRIEEVGEVMRGSCRCRRHRPRRWGRR